MRILPLLLAAPVALSAAAVQAFEFGASVGAEYANYDGVDYTQTRLSGDVLLSFGAGFEVQVGGTYSPYSDDTDVETTELHLIYASPAGFAVGAFVGAEDISGSPYDYYGVEGSYATNKWSVEVSRSEYTDEEFAANYTTLLGSYALTETLDVLAGFSGAEGDEEIEYFYLGGAFEVAPNYTLSATVGDIDYDGEQATIITAGLRYDFAKGVRFDRRGFTAPFPGY